MFDALKTLLKERFWVITAILGTFLVTFPFVTIGKDNKYLEPHAPVSAIPVIVGGVLLAVSVFAFAYEVVSKRASDAEGLDLSLVKESQGQLSTSASDCEICVVEGRIEEYVHGPGVVVVLPCNEYFDDKCAKDSRSALGAYVNRKFGTQAGAFVLQAKNEAARKFGKGAVTQKTETEYAESFGSGKCLLLVNPLDRPDPVALISTTTQRAGEGLNAQISCLFEGMHELVKCLADERLSEAVMPVLGGGHGGIRPPLAFIGLLLAVAEAAKYGRGAQRLKKVTIVVFKNDSSSTPEVDKTVVRRALALIAAQS